MLSHTSAMLAAVSMLSSIPSWATSLLVVAGGMITGAVTKYGWDLWEKLVPWFQTSLPALLKPFGVAIFAVVATQLGAWLNASLPTDIHLWNADTFSTLVTAGFAFLIHAIQTAQAAKASTPAATANRVPPPAPASKN